MSEAIEAQAPVENGKAPDAPPQTPQGLQLPEGTITLPQGMVARITRLLRENLQVQDALYSFLEGKEETGPYTLVLPVMLLVKPQQPGQGGP